MKNYYRKSAPKVKLGTVSKKNRWDLTPNYYNSSQDAPIFDKERPGRAYRHLILKKELYRFIEIVPQWDDIACGLNAVLLAEGDDSILGWHRKGVVAICAWDREIAWDDCSPDFYREHQEIFNKLNIPCHKNKGRRNKNYYSIEFDAVTAKAFQLIHVFIHELGHHHDRMTTKSKKATARGETYAEAYAKRFEDILVDRYFNELI